MANKKREQAPEQIAGKYFTQRPSSPTKFKGTRDLHPLRPFIISGGKVTERYYFQHLSKLTEFKFRIEPKFFGKESDYTKEFPKRIKRILSKNTGAKIFCVFDWDTVYGNKTNLRKHIIFKKLIKEEIKNGSVVLCPSMPCFEYWFLLHFNNTTQLILSCKDVTHLLMNHMKSFFSQSGVPLTKILKTEECVRDSDWVKKLYENGKLDKAIQRAEKNIKKAQETGELETQSYSYVYRVFAEYPEV